jgi:flagellar basal-body rod modification protein FlgD
MITAVRNTISPMFSAATTGGTPVASPPSGAAEPSQPRTLPTNPSGMGKDEFLKMLVAQLKNQDPMNPMDGKDMAAQLAQFSSVEQLVTLNKSMDASKTASEATAKALTALGESQTTRSDELAALIEGQMAMSTVGKVGVTTGNTVFVNRDLSGSLVIDSGTVSGPGRVTITDASGKQVAQGTIDKVGTGQQSFDLRDITFTPPLDKAGKYSFKFEVATDGGQQWQAVKTYTAGRITGMKYDQGNPILILGDSLSVPMSQLTQIRG